MTVNRQWTLNSHPNGRTTLADFQVNEVTLPEIKDGEILVKIQYVSVDPYMRGRISTAKSYAKGHEKGEVITGGAVGAVVETKSPKFAVGDYALTFSGWQEYAILDGEKAQKIDPSLAPVSTAVGVLGMPGLTAFVGLYDIGQPKEGETLLVSTAAGAVGSIVGQLGKIRGCRVVGITSTDEKVEFVKSLGFDEVINYKTTKNLAEDIAKACPKGIDVYFDNVGGETQEIAVKLLNKFGRIVLCGGISDYDADGKFPKGPNLTRLIGIEGRIQGFIVSSHAARFPEGIRELSKWIKEGKVKYRETVLEGFDKIPEAFISLFEGANTGKLLVKLY